MKELLGKEVTVIGVRGVDKKLYYLAQIDFELGITLKHNGHSEPGWSEEVCLNKKEFPRIMYRGTYEEHWAWWVEGIRAGAIDWSKKEEAFGLKAGYDKTVGSGASCAFES